MPLSQTIDRYEYTFMFLGLNLTIQEFDEACVQRYTKIGNFTFASENVITFRLATYLLPHKLAQNIEETAIAVIDVLFKEILRFTNIDLRKIVRLFEETSNLNLLLLNNGLFAAESTNQEYTVQMSLKEPYLTDTTRMLDWQILSSVLPYLDACLCRTLIASDLTFANSNPFNDVATTTTEEVTVPQNNNIPSATDHQTIQNNSTLIGQPLLVTETPAPPIPPQTMSPMVFAPSIRLNSATEDTSAEMTIPQPPPSSSDTDIINSLIAQQQNNQSTHIAGVSDSQSHIVQIKQERVTHSPYNIHGVQSPALDTQQLPSTSGSNIGHQRHHRGIETMNILPPRAPSIANEDDLLSLYSDSATSIDTLTEQTLLADDAPVATQHHHQAENSNLDETMEIDEDDNNEDTVASTSSAEEATEATVASIAQKIIHRTKKQKFKEIFQEIDTLLINTQKFAEIQKSINVKSKKILINETYRLVAAKFHDYYMNYNSFERREIRLLANILLVYLTSEETVQMLTLKKLAQIPMNRTIATVDTMLMDYGVVHLTKNNFWGLIFAFCLTQKHLRTT